MSQATQTTKDITVSVSTQYEGESNKGNGPEHYFTYYITIQNNGTNAVQLLTRYWEIFDSLNNRKFVTGDGVVGLQPIIEAGNTFSYNSFCILSSTIGFMVGTYEMIDTETDEKFDIAIPRFELIVDWKSN